jgi:hypothetical protein
MNWMSNLFYIEDFTAIRIGNIAGYECENQGIKDGIYIYQTRGEEKKLIEQKPIQTIERFKSYKWGFIRDYWTKNYRQFSAR